MNCKHTLASLMLASAFPLTALAAGGHYPVDDAGITDPGHFQIETWFTDFHGNNNEFALLPAWTPAGSSIELTAGLVRLLEDGDATNRFEPAAKWLFWNSDTIAISSALQLGFQDGDFNDLLLNLPLSYELGNAPVAIHANIGWIHDRAGDSNVDRLFLGGAFEWGVGDSLDLIGQLYREGADEELESQLGLRFHFDSPVEYLDLSVGRVLSGDDKDWFVIVGFGLAF